MTRPDEALLPPPLDEADCARDEAERGLQRRAIFHPLHAERGRQGRTGAGEYNTFKGVAIESGLVVAFFESTGLEGGLIRILSPHLFPSRTVSCSSCSSEFGGPKNEVEKRCGARGRQSGPPLYYTRLRKQKIGSGLRFWLCS